MKEYKSENLLANVLIIIALVLVVVIFYLSMNSSALSVTRDNLQVEVQTMQSKLSKLLGVKAEMDSLTDKQRINLALAVPAQMAEGQMMLFLRDMARDEGFKMENLSFSKSQVNGLGVLSVSVVLKARDTTATSQSLLRAIEASKRIMKVVNFSLSYENGKDVISLIIETYYK